MAKKKTVMINSDYPLLKTGLARNVKSLAEYLYKTNKYNIILYCCGTPWENPDYQRFPYKVVGTLPISAQEIDQINKDPGYARACSYGAYYIDRAVKEFKPDVIITSNDSWASDSWTSKKFWNKIHCIPHITLDSLPFLDSQIKYIKDSKQFLVWTEFAEKEAKRLGFNNVKTLTGIVEETDFKKLLRFQKEELRRRFSIPKDAFICGYVFRNQLRKELKPLMEGYSIFKKNNPKIKNTYLLLHTHFAEPNGWDIPKFIQEFNIDPKEILTTYVCKNCKYYEVKSYSGQDLKCPCCSSDKSQITCNVQLGVDESQLNEVYNLMDCYYGCMNAGGLEVPLVEALYAELPICTVAYSSGETFTDQPFTTSIDFAWTVQHGTQFRRAIPYPSSIAKFLQKIYELRPEERASLGKKGREWAVNHFTVDVIGKQWEKIIDDLPDVDWDFDFTEEKKNPDAVIDNLPDDKLWVKQLYSKILRMEVEDNDGGLTYWIESLKGGMKRDDIHQFFIKTAHNDNSKIQGKVVIKVEDMLCPDDKHRILLVLKESLGDHLILTSLLPAIENKYPGSSIYIACDEKYNVIYNGNKYVKKCIKWLPEFDNEMTCTGAGDHKGWFDVYINIGIGTQKILNYLTASY